MKEFKDYYLGLDLGTNSVGWAVTDEEYNILKHKGKYMWGTHSFESGKTAAERRGFRTARRRLKRKKQRIELLQSLFSEEISKVDFGFFQRLKESQYWIEDKSIKNENTLFMDENYTDKDYHKEYPTIYHLRKALIDDEESAFEVRKLYLAISHILSHRGHFLFEGEMSENNEFTNIFKDFLNFLNEEYEISLKNIDEKEEIEIKEILTDNKITRTQKCEKLFSIFKTNDKDNDKVIKQILNLLVGNSAKIDEIFVNEEIEKLTICFSNPKYVDLESEYEAKLGEKMFFVQKAKAIYDWSLLSKILKEHKYISDVKVDIYKEHKKDLKVLKNILKGTSYYNNVFRDGLYENYIRHNTKEEFIKEIKNILGKIELSDEVIRVQEKINLDNFLIKPINSDNAVLPRQIHQMELKKILENASERMEWLNKKDETGLSISEKIIKIFEFKIPYYVGPLNSSSPFAWVVRKENIKITPWNFEKVINVEETAEKFILRMTNKCTYLLDKDVIPKNSLLYQRFVVLNELNNLKIKGEKPSVDLKQEIYDKLFCENKKVGIKQLINFLKSKNYDINKNDISGIDGGFNNSLTSYNDMKSIFGDENIVKDNYKDMFEKIILWLTLYGDEKKIIKNKIHENYKNLISEEQLNKILKLKYKDWSRLSKEFLTEITGVNQSTGEVLSVIDMLWETNDNLMELYYKCGFVEKVNDHNNFENNNVEFNYDSLIKDLSVSPSVKKMIWKGLVIIKEIEEITKKAPRKIFIEMARDVVSEKKRTEKRKERIDALYKKIKEDKELINQLSQNLTNTTNEELKSKKLYLYYMQLGKCMYSGEKIELSELFDDNKYDIDHIYPQSKIKDDSFDNTVLTKKVLNQNKGDRILYYSIQNTEKWNWLVNFWSMLKEKELITNEKYNRLTRTSDFTDEELAGFINRQLVETRQSTKALSHILENIYKDKSTIVYVKAGLTSDFRQQFGIYKFRELNDYHHAHDGYLNIIVGNVYNTMFTNNPINFIKDTKKENRKYNLKKVFENKTNIWDKDKILPKIKRYVYRIRPLFTKASYEQKGGFSDQNISSPQEKLRSLKENHSVLNDSLKYGGFNNVKNSNFFIVEYTEKNKIKRSIEVIPIYIKDKISSKKGLIEYCINDLKMENPRILISKLKYKSLVFSGGHYYILNGKTQNDLLVQNGIQLILKEENYEILRKLSKELEYLKLTYKLAEIPSVYEKNILKILRKNKTEKELSLNEAMEKVDSLYNEIYEKLTNEKGIFKNLKINVLKYLEYCYSKYSYNLLTIYEKSRVIQEIVNIINKQQGKFDLKDVFDKNKGFGDGYQKGFNIRIGKSTILEDDFYILNQSPTGIFENRTYLPKKK